MTIYRVRRCVVCYVTRQAGTELLVLEGVDAAAGGPRVPSGDIRLGESLEDAALRQVAEETGLRDGVAWRRSLAVEDAATLPDPPRVDTFVHLEYAGPPRPVWIHAVEAGEDAGLAFRCRFVPLEDVDDLAGRQAAYLDRLR